MSKGDIYTLAECVEDWKSNQHYADYYKDTHWHLSEVHRKGKRKQETYVRMLRALWEAGKSGHSTELVELAIPRCLEMPNVIAAGGAVEMELNAVQPAQEESSNAK